MSESEADRTSRRIASGAEMGRAKKDATKHAGRSAKRSRGKRASSARSTRTGVPAGGASPRAAVARLARALPTALAIVIVLGIVGGAAFLDGELRAHAAQRRLGSPSPIEIHWPREDGLSPLGDQSWIPGAQRAVLEEALRSALGEDNPLTIDGLARVARAGEASGWFDGTPRVERMPDGTIRVIGQWRLPRAWIRHGEHDYLIDAEGRLMPMSVPIASPEPVRTPVVNPGASPPRLPDGRPDFSRVWASERVWEAIALIDLLREKPYFGQVGAIDLGGRASTTGLVIETDRGSRIIWGTGPSGFVPGERPASEKFYHLNAFFESEEFGRHIDAGTPGYDLRAGYIVFERTGPSGDQASEDPKPGP